MIEYLLANMWQLWAVVAVVGLILEMTSGDFFIMCVAIGAIGAAIVAPFSNIYGQLAVFVIVSFLSLWQVRPFVLRYIHKKDSSRVSNADALLGRVGRVSTAIPCDGYGYVAIDGDQWKAKTLDGEQIAEDEKVRVVNRESTIITVERDNKLFNNFNL